MKIVLLVVSIYLALILSTNLSAQELNWESDIDVAFEKSAKQHKPLMVFIKQKHCRWCKKMESKTLSDNNISTRLSKFILVKIDRNSLDADDVPYARYVPTIYMYSPKKELLITVGGYFVVEDFNSYLDDFYEKMKK